MREDRLDMFEIYLALMREVKSLEESTDSEGASSISLQLSFEKWIGCTDFANLIQNELTSTRQLLMTNTKEREEIVKYISNPFDSKLSKRALYRWLKVMKMPSSRELMVLNQALKVMKNRKDP